MLSLFVLLGTNGALPENASFLKESTSNSYSLTKPSEKSLVARSDWGTGSCYNAGNTSGALPS